MASTVLAAVDVGPADTFTCPRCRLTVAEVFYGPCTTCRAELVRTMGGEARHIDVVYEPKMNVTPNQVATKE